MTQGGRGEPGAAPAGPGETRGVYLYRVFTENPVQVDATELRASAAEAGDRLSVESRALVWLAVAAGLFLRFYRIDCQSLWFDELLSATAAGAESLAQLFSAHLVHHTHPPGYGVLLWGWARLFGDSEVSLRMSSALAGAAGLLVFWQMMRRRFAEPVAAVALVLLALTYPGIHFAQEGRPYAILILLATVATALWLDMLVSVDAGTPVGAGPLARFLAVAVLASQAHYYGLALVVFQGLGLLALSAARGVSVRGPLVVAALLAASYAPWIGVMAGTARGYSGFEGPGRPGLVWLLTFGAFLLYNKNLLSALVAVALFVAPAVAQARLLRERLVELLRGREARGWGLLFLVVVTTAVPMLVSQHTNILGHRYLVILCPAVYLLAAHWIVAATPTAAAAVRLTFGVCALALAVEVPKFYRPHNEQWREAAAHALAKAGPGDAVVAVTFPELFRYYFRQAGRPQLPETARPEELLERLARVKAAGGRSLFVLRARDPGLEPQVESALRRAAARAEVLELRHATVYRFDP
ncbi:MAG: glycosyltransferase family 39 protein [Candidatus Wallbacteria bacterium]|nr:glycosyltransferase family 39 protein [Candidatus Wallbacteria bacterium]